MYYLIDGYNFLFRYLNSKQSLKSQRTKIISSLQSEFEELGLQGKIVFDAKGEERTFGYKSPLMIAYSERGETADRYILEYLDGTSTPTEVTVVTDDLFLSAAARRAGAHTQSLKKFCLMLDRKHAKKELRKEPIFKESKREFERLLKIFEARKDSPE